MVAVGVMWISVGRSVRQSPGTGCRRCWIGRSKDQEMFTRGVVKKGGVFIRRVKQPVTLRVDADVLDWFKGRGKGYQTEMNAVLEAYVKAQKEAGVK